MKMEVEMEAADSQTSGGCLFMAAAFFVSVACLVGSVGVGFMFGAAQGLLCYAVLLLLCAAALFALADALPSPIGMRYTVARSVGRRERDKGRVPLLPMDGPCDGQEADEDDV